MNILPEIISKLSKGEVRNFKLFINRTNSERDRKDEMLFDLIARSYPDQYDEDSIFRHLYRKGNKNSFYRLKNKLLEDVGLSLSVFHFGERDVNLVLKDIYLAKIFFDKNSWEIARFYLNKAERRALAIENYELLDLIYTEFIKLSNELLDVNPQDFIDKRRENKKKVDDLREIDNILALAIFKIRTTQTFSKDAEPINQMLEKTVSKLQRINKDLYNSQLKLRIYQAISRILVSRQEYATLEDYLLKTFRDFLKEKLFNKNNHEVKLQLLVYICNTLYVNKKYARSLEFADILKKALHEFEGMLFNKYVYFYYNSLVINYSQTNRERAITTLHEALQIREILAHPMHTGFIYLNLAVLNFDEGAYKLSLKSLLKLTQSNSYPNLDEAFRLNVAISELLVRYELKDLEYIETRCKSINKDHRQLLALREHARDKEFLGLLRTLARKGGDLRQPKIQAAIRNFIARFGKGPRQTEAINYVNWLEKHVNPSASA